MTDLMLAGRPDSALPHLAPVGLTSILRDGGDRSARSWWDLESARPYVRSALSVEQLAGEVIEHAGQRSGNSWLNAKITGDSRRGMSLFSPRIKSAQLDEWEGYVAERDAWLKENRSALTPLDLRLLAGLGQPAWWRCNPRESRPDDGASRWEMKTRNRGEEFLANRLSPLTKVLAERQVEQVIDGLTGDAVVDEDGKNAPDSRTSTGLTVPGPVDSTLAYVALWAIASLRLLPRRDGISGSAGMCPRDRVHPTVCFLPVFATPVTPRRFEAVAASRELDQVGIRHVQEAIDDVGGSGEDEWLREQGVYAVAAFPIRKAGSASAPERQILTGELSIL